MARSVLLVVGGGVAAYKALELVRLFRRAGIGVRAILTKAGAEFVTPLSLATLTGERVHDDLWSLTDEAEIGHIQLSRSADLIVVAPATADLMAKAAHGLADDLASTALLATDTPVLMAPAMNVRMWLHPATRRNAQRLRGDGIAFVGPDEGEMACGEFGPGRMAEPAAIFEAACAMLERPKGGVIPVPPPAALTSGAGARPLQGRHALVTAGPTQEPIDPVRFLSNRSSGRQGYAVAGALAELGARVTLVSGPVSLDAPPGVDRVWAETAAQMARACEAALPVDVAVMAAAVADWRPSQALAGKLKKAPGAPPPALALAETQDILQRLSTPGPRRPRLVVGFAAETSDVEANARDKLARKGCDWIVANDVAAEEVFGAADNTVALVTREGVERWPRLPKAEVARRLAERIAEALASPASREGRTA